MTEVLDKNDDILSEAPTENDPKIENAEIGCSKPKRRRRGKKRRNKSQDNDDSKCNEQDNIEESKGNSKNNSESRKRQKLLIRPTDVPKAPENSTQFIIDDHDECHLYFSFETPDPYKEKSEGDANEVFYDAALHDIDYEYESMQDLDNTAYYLQDFELSYSKYRYEETMRLTKPDLVTALENLEVRVRELEHKMYEKDPGSALDQLQRKLLRLQEENIALREEQQHLRKTEVSEESGSDDILMESGSEHLENSDDEHEINELDESDEIFAPSEDDDDIYDDRANFSDSSNEQNFVNDIEPNNSNSDGSVSSIIYGLQEYNHSNSDENEDNDYLMQNATDNLQLETMCNDNLQDSMPSDHLVKNFDSDMSRENSQNYVLLENSNSDGNVQEYNEELLDPSNKQLQENFNTRQLQQNCSDKQVNNNFTNERLTGELDTTQKIHNNEPLSENPHAEQEISSSTSKQLQETSNNENVLKTSHIRLSDSNVKQLQNNHKENLESDLQCVNEKLNHQLQENTVKEQILDICREQSNNVIQNEQLSSN